MYASEYCFNSFQEPNNSSETQLCIQSKKMHRLEDA